MMTPNKVINHIMLLKTFILGFLKFYPTKTSIIPDIIEVFKNAKNKDFQDVSSEVFQEISKIKSLSDLSEESILGILETGQKLLKKYSDEGQDILVFNELPDILRNRIRYSPSFLFVKGNSSLLNSNDKLRIGIVGTREPSKIAIENVERVVEIIEPYEAMIVSGVDEEVDTHAHIKSLQRNLKNIGFLGYGIEKIPSRTKALISQITASGGVVVSVFHPFRTHVDSLFLKEITMLPSSVIWFL